MNINDRDISIIKQMRNIVAHRYGTVDTTAVWDIIKVDIPELKEHCHKIAEQG